MVSSQFLCANRFQDYSLAIEVARYNFQRLCISHYCKRLLLHVMAGVLAEIQRVARSNSHGEHVICSGWCNWAMIVPSKSYMNEFSDSHREHSWGLILLV